MLNERISKVRKEFGLTQEKFAERIGLTQNFVWMIEKGHRIPSNRTIADICREFHVNETWLRTGEGEMFATEDQQQEIAEFFADFFEEYRFVEFAILQAIAQIPKSGWERIRDFAVHVVETAKTKEEKQSDKSFMKRQ